MCADVIGQPSSTLFSSLCRYCLGSIPKPPVVVLTQMIWFGRSTGDEKVLPYINGDSRIPSQRIDVRMTILGCGF